MKELERSFKAQRAGFTSPPTVETFMSSNHDKVFSIVTVDLI